MYLYEVILISRKPDVNYGDKYLAIEAFFSDSDLPERKILMEAYGWTEGIDSHVFHKGDYEIRITMKIQTSFSLKTVYELVRIHGKTGTGYYYQILTTTAHISENKAPEELEFENIVYRLADYTN
jgi:hypothetical protein